jgi:transposase
VQETFVGLDVARDSVVATAVDPMGQLIDQSTLGLADGESIAYLRRLPGSQRVVLQACTMWEHFRDAAVQAGADVVLSYPCKTRLISDASLNSDKVDSEALATLLRLHALPTAYVPDATARVRRRIVRDRRFYLKHQRAVASHTYAILLARGIAYEDGIMRLKRRREELRSYGLPEVNQGLGRLRELDGTTLDLDRSIRQAFEDSREAQLLESIPGIGKLTAVALAAFPCPIDRFENSDQVSSYCGPCPTNHQSGDNSHQGALKRD